MQKRILVFDAQVFQTPAWHRGMGKYSFELISSLVNLNQKTKQWEKIVVILSKRIDTDESVLRAVAEVSSKIEIAKLDLSHNEYDNRPVAERNRAKLDDYMSHEIEDSQLDGVDYMVLSLMQSEVAPAFSSLPEVHNYLLFYDLIPLMFHRTYLKDSINKKGYLSKLSELLKADTYLAISKTVANDLSAILGIDPNRIVSIDGAPIAHGHEAKKLKVPKPFILMPTGNDLRKNNRRGIEGFKLFNQGHDDKFHLVITSTFQDFEVNEYKKITDKVIFTGNITGEELEYLYQETTALLFPTEYEGLGLPILEALEKDKPVACSDISVFQEISTKAFSYFDPKKPESIAAGLGAAVSTKNLPLKEYKRVLDKFTWQRTADIFAQKCIENTPKSALNMSRAMSLFCGATDESGTSTEVQQLYSELSRFADVELFMDTDGIKNEKKINYLTQIANVTFIDRPTKITLPATELPIYYIEDEASCSAVLLVALANPGVVVLKDDKLTNLWKKAVERGLIHPTRLEAEKSLQASYDVSGLLVSLVASQRVVIVHTALAKKKIEKLLTKLPTSLRPKIIQISAPSSQLVYPELSQDMANYDYPGESIGNNETSIHDFARILSEVSSNG